MPPECGSPREWLQRARAGLALARVPLPEGAFLEDLCFHAQQAAEKSLRAVLLPVGVEFPHVHSLHRLFDLLPASVPCPEALREAERLTDYAVQSRYPSDAPPVSQDEYREALRLAAAVVEWAEATLESSPSRAE